jgi:SAM-dependent methyltransferase
VAAAAQLYYPAPDTAARYAKLLPSFGAAPELAAWAADYASGHAGRCQWDARFLAGRLRSGRVLNIGGAPFLFEMVLRAENPNLEIFTVDLNPERFPGVEQTLGLRVIRGDVERVDWQLDEKFDCVVFAEILEHLRVDLLGTLRRIKHLLTPQGILYLTTPNGLSFANIYRHYLHGRTGPSPVNEWGKLANLGHMGHVREYSAVEVREMLATCGYSVDELIMRSPKDGNWPLRDMLIRRRARFADELVILAQSGVQ